jgi:dTDP-4-amino-4,6-dideoxygalactose transaminase
MNWQVPLCRPAFQEDDLKALVEAYRSTWLTTGPRTANLEEAFCEYTGAKHAVAVSSCSAALHLSCLAAGLGPGDEVIVPALTFTSTVSAVTHTGATPRFADIAGATEPWLSAATVEEAITDRTRAILTMSYGGNLGETAAIAEIAADRDLILLEDAAHAAGSRSAGRHAGTFGLAGSFSFSASKNLGIGEGGMLVTDDRDVASRVARQSWHGLGSQPWLRHHQSTPEYELGSIGFNYRFDDPRAALVHSLLDRLDEENLRRKAIDEAYREAFSKQELLVPTLGPRPGDQSSYCLFTAVVDSSVARDEFRKALADRGIQTTVHYPLLHKGGAHMEPDAHLPITEGYASRCVTLPLFPLMEAWQRDLVIESVDDALEAVSRPAAAA